MPIERTVCGERYSVHPSQPNRATRRVNAPRVLASRLRNAHDHCARLERGRYDNAIRHLLRISPFASL
jgi:hypothetical protein